MNKIIAIDPDLSASGVAMFDTKIKKLTLCTSLKMWSLFDLFLSNKNALVLVEYSDKNAVWHKGKQTKNINISKEQATAINVGKNKAVGKIIIDFLKTESFNYKVLEPAGYSKYFENSQFFMQQTQFFSRTNKDARAAASMIYKNLYHRLNINQINL